MLALDYVPNLSARGLRNGRTGVIGLALPDLARAYSAELTHHFMVAAHRRGLSLQIEESGGGAEAELQLISRARAHLIDGLILNPVQLETSAVQRGMKLPPLLLIGEVEQPIADHLWIDNTAAVRDLTALLLARGHRRIAALGVTDQASAQLRVAGFLQAHREVGITPWEHWSVRTSRWTPLDGVAATAAQLAEHGRPDAVVCFTDSLALGAIHALWSVGWSVPGDVSVVGYDDIVEGQISLPPLTTIGFDKVAFAELALGLLTERIADPDQAVRRVVHPYAVIERASVGTRPAVTVASPH